MKTLLLLLATLVSCQSVYVDGAHTNFQHGIAQEATDHQAGIEVGGLVGTEVLALDVGVRSDHGNARMVQNEQLTIHLGARLSAPRDYAVQPYVGAGFMQQWNSFETEAYDYGDSTTGTYIRLGVQVPVSESVSLDIGYERSDLGRSTIGGREGLNLQNDVLLLGFSLNF